MAKELFRPLYAPQGCKYADARNAGLLKPTETWFIRVRHNGKTFKESTGTREYEEAKEFLKKWKEARALGKPIIKRSQHVTFGDMAERLKQDYDRNGKHRRTLDARLARLLPVFGARRLADLIPDDVDRYVTKRHEAKASAASINRELEVLARAFTLGCKLGLTTATLRVRDHRLKEAPPRSGFFEPAQYAAVLRHLTHTVVREVDGRRRKVNLPADDLRLACSIAYAYGWRMQSEILTLERRHVDLDAAGGMGTLSLDPGSTKNDDARVVVLTPELRSAIAEQLKRLDTFHRASGIITPYLFVHTEGVLRGQRVKDFARAWRTACKAAGIPGRLRHDFRRTAVRGLVNAGVPAPVAMEMTGHKTDSVFRRYHIVSQSDHVRAARLLAQASSATPQASATTP